MGDKGLNSAFKGPYFKDKGPNSAFKGPHFEDNDLNSAFKGPQFEHKGQNFEDKGPNSAFKGPYFLHDQEGLSSGFKEVASGMKNIMKERELNLDMLRSQEKQIQDLRQELGLNPVPQPGLP